MEHDFQAYITIHEDELNLHSILPSSCNQHYDFECTVLYSLDQNFVGRQIIDFNLLRPEDEQDVLVYV